MIDYDQLIEPQETVVTERPLTTIVIETKTVIETRRVEKRAFKPSVFRSVGSWIGGAAQSIISATVSLFIRP